MLTTGEVLFLLLGTIDRAASAQIKAHQIAASIPLQIVHLRLALRAVLLAPQQIIPSTTEMSQGPVQRRLVPGMHKAMQPILAVDHKALVGIGQQLLHAPRE
jgi:hypothetical protein